MVAAGNGAVGKVLNLALIMHVMKLLENPMNGMISKYPQKPSRAF